MKIIVCGRLEDVVRCKKKLTDKAKKHDVDVDIELITSGKQLLFNIESRHTDVDLIYLDYNLEDGNGIDIAGILRKKGVSADIIFYTADESHVNEGYDVDALHYLIKNRVSDEKFEQIFLKAINRCRKRNEEVISLFCAGERRKIELSSIQYFEVKKRIVCVHYGDQETFEFYSTLSRLEEILYGKGFLRIHQAFLVSTKYVQQKTKQTVILNDKTVLPIGRSYQKKVSV